MRRMLIGVLAAALVAAPTALAHHPPAPPAKQPTAVGRGGAAATVDQQGTQAAIEALRHGGNAVDAAVAAATVLGVVEPYSCGIGGGGFMSIYTARDGQVHTIDSRETAPAAMKTDSFVGLQSFEAQRVSGMSVGVPGTVRAWQKALDEYGTWSLRRALKPGIVAALRGFTVDQTFFNQTDEAKAIFADFPATAALYLDPDGTPRDVGTAIRNPDLAKTYALLAAKGPDAFYSGPLAQAIVDTVHNPPLRAGSTRSVRAGLMELSDLAGYRAIDREPTHIGYRGLDIYGMAPPSSGGSTVGEILNILEGYPMSTLAREQALHYFIEASRYAYADRGAFIADPGFVSVPLAKLLSDAFAAQRRDKITETAAMSPVAPGDPDAVPDGSASAARVGSTTNLTVSDRWGNVVDYTFTIEQTGGNGMVVPGYGFLLNNELTDFNLTTSTDPAVEGGVSTGANRVEPGKRPRSSIAPTIVLRDGKPFLALGSPGGASIITTVAQVLLDRLDFGMTLPEAIAAPRVSQRNSATTQTEAEFLGTAEAAALQARGHVFTVNTGTGAEIGAVTGIEFLGTGAALAAAEPVRRGGGSAMALPGGHDHGGRQHAWRGSARSRR
ncbi:MAG TPA: gamma-glutamyltransferase [Solirubrobacteraceae bacterium]|nr:gamma-glutamyltransferase [Solirubrobacteraceae bacterium]